MTGVQTCALPIFSGASAASTQVNPLNLNIVVRNKSPGDEGPVTQTNASTATAGAANANVGSQGSGQLQNGGGSPGGQSQLASQSVPTSQATTADATSSQVAPTNANISISVDPAAVDPGGSAGLGTLIQIWIPGSSGSTVEKIGRASCRERVLCVV